MAAPHSGNRPPRTWYTTLVVVGLVVFATIAHAQVPDGLGELAARARADSNDAQLNYQVARAFWAAKNWDEAEHYLREAITVAPQYAEALFALGQLPAARGEKYWKKFETMKGHAALDSALDRYTDYQRRALMINPLVDLSIMGEVDAWEWMSFGSYGATMRVWWVRPWQRAATMLHKGDFAGSYALLDSVKHVSYFADPNSIPLVILWYHGLAAARVKAWDAAIEDYAQMTGRAVQRDKDIAAGARLFPLPTNNFRYGLGTMLFLAGRYHQAAPVFRRVLEVDLSIYPAHVQLARMLEAEGNWPGAIVEREQAVAAFPEDATLHVDLAVAQMRGGRMDDAINTMTEAMKVNPRDYRIPLLLGEMLVAAGRGKEARAPYERFLAIAPLRLTEQMAQVRQSLAQIQ